MGSNHVQYLSFICFVCFMFSMLFFIYLFFYCRSSCFVHLLIDAKPNMNVSGAWGLCTLCCLGLLVLFTSSDVHASVVVPNRPQRGFKDNVSNRIAHGFGKRTFQDTYDLAPSIDDR